MPGAWTHPLVQPKQWKGDMRFGTCNIRRLYRSGSLTTVARELARYKLDFEGIWDEVGQQGNCKSRGLYFFFYRKGNKNHQLGTGLFCMLHNSISSQVSRISL